MRMFFTKNSKFFAPINGVLFTEIPLYKELLENYSNFNDNVIILYIGKVRTKLKLMNLIFARFKH